MFSLAWEEASGENPSRLKEEDVTSAHKGCRHRDQTHHLLMLDYHSWSVFSSPVHQQVPSLRAFVESGPFAWLAAGWCRVISLPAAATEGHRRSSPAAGEAELTNLAAASSCDTNLRCTELSTVPYSKSPSSRDVNIYSKAPSPEEK